MLGDLAGDEGPVIVSDDAVVTVVAAEAAEILGLEPGSAVVAAVAGASGGVGPAAGGIRHECRGGGARA